LQKFFMITLLLVVISSNRNYCNIC
jgi:hypothetical protein